MTSKSFLDISTQVDCEHQYFGIGEPSSRTVIFTIIIVVFTLLIEIFAHYNFGATSSSDSKKDDEAESLSRSRSGSSSRQPLPTQPQPEPTPQPQAQPGGNEEKGSTTESKKFESCCIADPSPSVRANRCAAAILLYIPIAVAFFYRLAEAKVPEVRYVCRQYLADEMYPNWWAITFLNIIPFISATFALLRTLVDCWLVRYGKSLGYADKEKCMWVPCMPAGIVFGVVISIWFLMKLSVSCCMGQPQLAFGDMKKGKKKEGDVEMQAEEARRLVDDMDGESVRGNEDSDGPPAYDSVYDAETSRTSSSSTSTLPSKNE